MSSILNVEQVSKIYQSGSKTVQVLDEINFDVKEGKNNGYCRSVG